MQLQKKCFKANEVKTCIDLINHCKQPTIFPHNQDTTYKHALMLSSTFGYPNLSSFAQA